MKGYLKIFIDKMIENKQEELRFKKTVEFLKASVPEKVRILDLGTPNNLSKELINEGYNVKNTSGEDLDLEPEILKKFDVDLVTAFEIFEHLISPFTVLQNLPANKLVATVPLRLWFSPAYRSSTDPWDRHYHEFEDWQFDWLLEKAGWKILKREKWTSPTNEIGIRPVLRKFTPRYYAIYAERL